ncbi:hypothetical protein [Paucidesulfovibrio longus]|uniref:hypothetical protein n=1 Tax=Paucidesulfovibrio longus TaxID=889 RepID=UPI0003B61758|nr:hypothetical protein [Paucidesulfovibrio longus]
MRFEVRHHIEENVLVIEVSGDLSTYAASERLLEENRALMRASGKTRVLIDMGSVEKRLEVGDAFFFVRNVPALEKHYRCAFLDRPAYRDYSLYYEATAKNAGHDFKVFFDRSEALQWLRSEKG